MLKQSYFKFHSNNLAQICKKGEKGEKGSKLPFLSKIKY